MQVVWQGLVLPGSFWFGCSVGVFLGALGVLGTLCLVDCVGLI